MAGLTRQGAPLCEAVGGAGHRGQGPAGRAAVTPQELTALPQSAVPSVVGPMDIFWGLLERGGT